MLFASVVFDSCCFLWFVVVLLFVLCAVVLVLLVLCFGVLKM